MEELLALFGGADAASRWLAVGALTAARLGPLTVLAPWLAMRSSPPTLRAVVVLGLTLALAPLAAASAGDLPTDPASLALLALREALLGAVFAVASALPLFALDWAGRLVDTWRGASLAEVIAPPTGERTSPVGDLYLMLGVALFATLGGHRLALAAFADGLTVAPLGDLAGGSSPADVALGAARLFASAVAFAAAWAAPAALAVVLADVSLGLVGRSAPQIPVFFAGMPLRAAAGLAAALLSLAIVVDELPGAFRDAVAAATTLLSP